MVVRSNNYFDNCGFSETLGNTRLLEEPPRLHYYSSNRSWYKIIDIDIRFVTTIMGWNPTTMTSGKLSFMVYLFREKGFLLVEATAAQDDDIAWISEPVYNNNHHPSDPWRWTWLLVAEREGAQDTSC
jgi:hypothetical protein